MHFVEGGALLFSVSMITIFVLLAVGMDLLAMLAMLVSLFLGMELHLKSKDVRYKDSYTTRVCDTVRTQFRTVEICEKEGEVWIQK